MSVRACFLLVLSLLTHVVLAPVTAVANDLRIEAAYILEPPPTAGTAAAYFTAINSGTSPVTIVGAVGRKGTLLEVHRSSTTGEVARMERVARVLINAGEFVAFEPGGLHVMIHDAELSPGDEVPFELVLGNGEHISVLAHVSAREHNGSRAYDEHHHPHDPGGAE